MRVVLDLETNGLLDKEDLKLHCMVLRDLDTNEVMCFEKDTMTQGLELLDKVTTLVGHNLQGFDMEVLKRLYGYEFTSGKLFDTLILARLMHPDVKEKDFVAFKKQVTWVTQYPNLIGSHSLKAWGFRLNCHKGEYGETSDWELYTSEMLEYCKQDTEVTKVLFELLSRSKYSKSAIELEHSINSICNQQTKDGFPFDVAGACELYSELIGKRAELETQLKDKFGSWWTNKGEVVPKRTLNFKDKTRGSLTKDGKYTRITFTEFNANSREHIAKRLIDLYGWKPKVFTENGQPKVDEAVLSELDYPHAQLLSEYLMLQKRIGQLAEGKQAWLKVERNGKIHGRVNTMGAVTSRCTHSNPNMAQVPSVSVKYGRECRILFHSPPDSLLCGVDISGLELRCLAHYMSGFDGGKYGEALLQSDIHTRNQKAAGLETRDQAKTFIYAFLYGAGSEKLGSIVGGGKKEGAKLRNKFLYNVPALKQLRDAVSKQVKTKGYIKGLDGRRIPIRSEHAALNSLLQGAGAIICKRWLVIFHEMLKARGITDVTQVAYVHDEVQLVVKGDPGNAKYIGKLCVQAIERTGKFYNFRLPLTGEYSIGRNWAETH